ncbi:hypothetical protein KSS87_022911, partial [Heliosperma pusillum]
RSWLKTDLLCKQVLSYIGSLLKTDLLCKRVLSYI